MIRLLYWTQAEAASRGLTYDEREPHPRLRAVVCTVCAGEEDGHLRLHTYADTDYWGNPNYEPPKPEDVDAEPYWLGTIEVWWLVRKHFEEMHAGIPESLEGPIEMTIGLGHPFGALEYLSEHQP